MSTLLLFVLVCFSCADSAKILGFFQFPSLSHQIIFQPLWKELSLRGHEVTVITPNPLNDPNLRNLTEIDVRFAYDLLAKQDLAGNLGKHKSSVSKIVFIENMMKELVESQLHQRDVQELLKYDENHFDLVLVQALHPLVYIFGAKFKAPVIGMSSFEIFPEFHDAVGNPTHPVISPLSGILGFEGKLSFMDRVQSVLFNFWYRTVYYWYILPEADRTVRKYLGNKVPYLGDVIGNTSIFLVNGNCIVHNVRANVPNVIQVSQMHIKEKKPLPKDLQDYLDSATEGVIYLSLGTNIISANMSTRIRDVIIQALSELPYKVLWKWETDYLPGQPDNVMTKKWIPQQDVLGHPNVRAFITQGGLQSIEEAIRNEVPMVGLPFMSDQPNNVKKLEDFGIAIGVDHKTMTKNQLKTAILKVAENKRYKDQVRKAKDILTDQPLQGLEKAVWWVEYVIRHQGAKHLRSPAADMTFFEYFMVDVAIFLMCCILAISYVVVNITKLIMSTRIQLKRKVS
nr:UDP-glucuronosyltransferase 2B7-like [Leptinotarsa decemlineata]